MTERRTDTATLVVPAGADRVYEAFADADALLAWLPPQGMSGRAPEYDFREHGRYLIELTYGDDAPAAGKTTERTDVTYGRFLELVPGQRIVQSVAFDSADPRFAGEMIMTWTFEPVAGGTRVTVGATHVPPGITQADHLVGLKSTLENLARHCR